MAKCLVTGGLGFIGSNLVEMLIEAGHEVLVVDNLSTGTLDNRNWKSELKIIDIQDDYELLQLPKVDYVFHLAALARIQPSIQDPISSHNVNVTGTLNILEYCRKNEAKLIFSSSSSIYKGDVLPTSEVSTKDPKNPYALQKWICEQYIGLYGKLFDLDYTILRYFNVYGERQIPKGAYAAVMGIFLEQKAKGKSLTITNDGEQRRDFTYVKDVGWANILSMSWPRGAFNIGSGNNCSVNEVADWVGGDKKYVGETKGEVRETLAENIKARSYGWAPSVTVKEWLNGQN